MDIMRTVYATGTFDGLTTVLVAFQNKIDQLLQVQLMTDEYNPKKQETDDYFCSI